MVSMYAGMLLAELEIPKFITKHFVVAGFRAGVVVVVTERDTWGPKSMQPDQSNLHVGCCASRNVGQQILAYSEAERPVRVFEAQVARNRPKNRCLTALITPFQEVLRRDMGLNLKDTISIESSPATQKRGCSQRKSCDLSVGHQSGGFPCCTKN